LIPFPATEPSQTKSTLPPESVERPILGLLSPDPHPVRWMMGVISSLQKNFPLRRPPRTKFHVRKAESYGCSETPPLRLLAPACSRFQVTGDG
jgi:hypothetical protein